jgi:hypothetical protein
MSDAFDQITDRFDAMTDDEKRSFIGLLRSNYSQEQRPDLSDYVAAEYAHTEARDKARRAAKAAESAWSDQSAKRANGATSIRKSTFGWAIGQIQIAEDFDAPLEDFKDYME